MDKFAYEQDFLISIGADKAPILKALVAKQKPKTIVELGGYLGYSAILFAESMRLVSSKRDEKFQLWSLEFDPKFAAIATKIVALAGLSDMVTVVTGPSLESLRKLVAEKRLKHIALLFLDHVEDLYKQDLKLSLIHI